MATFRIPFIQPDDYDSFRKLTGLHLPSAYDEWLQLHNKQRDNYVMRWHHVTATKVDPDEFIQFCRARQRACDNDALRIFAENLPDGN
jgi:hypothetical protein